MRKWSILFLTFLIFGLSLFAVIKTFALKTENVFGNDNIAIYLDPGHGGFDGGAIGNDETYEKDIVLAITLKLERYLRQRGFRVYMTRRTDIALHTPGTDDAKRDDIYKRVSLINESDADLFLTIHANAFPQHSVKGAQAFFSTMNPSSAELARSIQTMVGFYDESNKRLSKSISDKYLLDHVTIPGCLVEVGFLSNPEELEKLKTDAYMEKIAFIIYVGVLQYLEKSMNDQVNYEKDIKN
jgi:N-acetylmuramoyl-L-alanine amidase